jgi:hypothetical protein
MLVYFRKLVHYLIYACQNMSERICSVQTQRRRIAALALRLPGHLFFSSKGTARAMRSSCWLIGVLLNRCVMWEALSCVSALGLIFQTSSAMCGSTTFSYSGATCTILCSCVQVSENIQNLHVVVMSSLFEGSRYGIES